MNALDVAHTASPGALRAQLLAQLLPAGQTVSPFQQLLASARAKKKSRTPKS